MAHVSTNATWVDYPSTATLITAATLENIEGAIDTRPRGVIARYISSATNSAGTTNTTQTTALKVAELSASMISGRLYRVEAQCAINGPASATALSQLNYTVDGSTPDASSTRFRYQCVDCSPAVGLPMNAGMEGFYVAGSNLTFKVALSFCSLSGASVVMTVETSRPMEIAVVDVGVDPGATGTRF